MEICFEVFVIGLLLFLGKGVRLVDKWGFLGLCVIWIFLIGFGNIVVEGVEIDFLVVLVVEREYNIWLNRFDNNFIILL